jgi:hypothetical protein
MAELARWRWPLAAVVAVAIVAGGVWLVVDRIARVGEAAARAPGEVAAGLERAARGLLTGDVTQRFLSSIPEVRAPRAGNLELAVVDTVEELERRDERRAFWDLVPLGTATVGLRVPVTWRYHVPMAGRWHAEVTDGVLRVRAPRLRPSQPPAVHTDRIERRVEADWLRFDAPERLAELERALTPILAVRAGDRRHLALAREPARRALGEFAQGWLVREGAWEPDAVRAIVVRFADEPAERETAPVVALP